MHPRSLLPDAETVIGVPIMADDSDSDSGEYEGGDDDDFVGMEVFRFGWKSSTTKLPF